MIGHAAMQHSSVKQALIIQSYHARRFINLQGAAHHNCAIALYFARNRD